MSEPVRFALIGAGTTARAHAAASRAAGLTLAAVCARTSSARSAALAAELGTRAFDGVDELLRARETWDAAIVAVPVEATLPILEQLLAADVPLLVEKPVASSSEALRPVLSRERRVIVGYNRRFYRTVRAARDFARQGPVLAALTLPERVAGSSGNGIAPLFAVAVHALDVARFVLGDLQLVAVERTRRAGRVAAVGALARTERSDIVHVLGAFDAPANFALSLDRHGERFELRPFESATVYSGLDVHDPSSEHPYRRHEPRVRERIELDAIDRTHKPGFVAQARALAALARGEPPNEAARLSDAFAVLRLAEELMLG